MFAMPATIRGEMSVLDVLEETAAASYAVLEDVGVKAGDRARLHSPPQLPLASLGG